MTVQGVFSYLKVIKAFEEWSKIFKNFSLKVASLFIQAL